MIICMEGGVQISYIYIVHGVYRLTAYFIEKGWSEFPRSLHYKEDVEWNSNKNSAESKEGGPRLLKNRKNNKE